MDDVVLRLILRDEFKSTLESYKKELKAAQQESAQGGKELSGVFGDIEAQLVEIGKAGAFAAVIAGLQSAMAAASETEQVNAKLTASLKATGQYSEEAAAGLEEWSLAMMRTKAVDDELAASLVADAVAKGKNVEQSKRLLEAAADLAPVVGSVETAMGLLTRASNGSLESLKRYGIEVTDAEAKSGDFESVLRRVEKQFAGQAAAQVETYAEQVKLLGREFENFRAAIGKPLIEAATDWLAMLNNLIAKSGELERAMSGVNKNATYMQLAEQLSTLNTEKDRLNKLLGREGKWGSFDIDFTEVRKKLADTETQIDKVLAKMGETTSAAKKAGTSVAEAAGSGKSSASEFKSTATTDAAGSKGSGTKTAFYEYSTTAEAIEAFLKAKAAWDGIGEHTSLYALRAAQADAASEAAAKKIDADFDKAKAEVEANTEKLREAFNISEALDDAATQIEEAVSAGEGYMDAAVDDFKARQQEIWEGYLYTVADIVNTAITGGDVQGAVASAAGSMMAQITTQLAASLGAAAGPIGSIIGTLVSTALAKGSSSAYSLDNLKKFFANPIWGSASFLSDLFGGTRTEGGKGRESLRDLLHDMGFDKSDYGSGDSQSGAYSDAELAATGKSDMWAALVEQITGSDKVGYGANILADAFGELDLTAGQTIDALGGMIAAAQGVSEAEGDQIAAQTALLSVSELTNEELAAFAQAYGDATNYINQKSDLQDKILEDAQAYADATGSKKDEALKTLRADYDAYVKLVSAEAETQKQNDAELAEALEEQGLSKSEATTLVNSQKSAKEIAAKSLAVLEQIAANTGEAVTTPTTTTTTTTTTTGGGTGIGGHTGLWPTLHHGRMVEGYPSHQYWIRDDEAVVPPEKFRQFADAINGAGGGSYSSTRTIILQLNGRTISEALDEERSLRRIA